MKDSKEIIYQYQPLWNNWYIDMPIGQGSFGSVYKVSREDMGHTYTSAVKIISVPSDIQLKEAEATFGGDATVLIDYFEDITQNIINEINILYALSGNSNIISYHDHQVIKREKSTGWDILIRMEYITPLRKYIANNTLKRQDVIRLGIDVCTALELCGNNGIIHRDVKDDNIFVNEAGIFKIGDFGIAKELSKSSSAASMRGTPLYMAPEVYRGEKYDARVDIYSLGIVMYKLMNDGRMPFLPRGANSIRLKDNEAAFEKRITGEKLMMPLYADDTLGKIILRACEYEPNMRYSTVREMKKELEDLYQIFNRGQLEEVILTPINKNKNQSEIHNTVEKSDLNEATIQMHLNDQFDYQPLHTSIIMDNKSKDLKNTKRVSFSSFKVIVSMCLLIVTMGIIGVLSTRPEPIEVPKIITPVKNEEYGMPDLIPLKITSSSAEYHVGEKIVFRGGFQNAGKSSNVLFKSTWYANQEYIGAWYFHENQVVSPSEIVTKKFTWTPKEAGVYSIRVELDSDQEVAEVSEENNMAIIEITVVH